MELDFARVGLNWSAMLLKPTARRRRRALRIVERLLLDPRSHLRSELLGGPQFLGWDDLTYAAADTRDGIWAIMTGLAAEKFTEAHAFPRPVRDDAADDGGTVADFDVAAFLRRLAGA